MDDPTVSQPPPSIFLRAIQTWGRDAQVMMAFEEMGELMTAIAQFERYRVDEHAVAEEIADVMIMMEQMAVLYGSELVGQAKARKLERLEARLTNNLGGTKT